MKQGVPEYKNRTNMHEVFGTLSKRNQRLITDFLDYCAITATETTLVKIKGKAIIIADVFQKDLGKLTLKDIRDFLRILNKSNWAISTKNDTKKVLKRFLKWKYEDWSSRFNQLDDIKINGNDQRQLSKNDLLTFDEMRIIISSIESLKYKTILLLLQETAARPQELMALKWRDVSLGKKEIKLHSSKTDKTRHIPINESAAHLSRYKTECFSHTPRADDFVFPSPKDKRKHLTGQALQDFLDRLERRLEFRKHLYPYLWRHSILTNMIKKLSPKVYQQYAGHSLETGMRIYAHLDTDDLKEELYSKIYVIEDLTGKDNKKLKAIENRIKKLEATIHVIIDKANIVFDKKCSVK
jgi:integrase